MNIPDKVKIGGVNYKVIRCNDPSEEDSRVDGQILYHKQEIRLKTDMSKEYEELVFLHETIYGIFEYICFEQDENMVIRLSNALHGFIKDNPNLFRENIS